VNREFPPEPADYCEAVHPIYHLRCLNKASEEHTIHSAHRRETARYVYWSNGAPKKVQQQEQLRRH
jgi:hypothetical protein